MRAAEAVKRDLVERWLEKAEQDFGVCRHLLTDDVSYPFAVAFHAQQAVEKLLKGFLTLHQVEFPKTHDINELLDLASAVDAILAESLRGAHTLTKYGVNIRYPGDQPDVSADEAKQAFEAAADARSKILPRLEPYVRGNEGM